MGSSNMPVTMQLSKPLRKPLNMLTRWMPSFHVERRRQSSAELRSQRCLQSPCLQSPKSAFLLQTLRSVVIAPAPCLIYARAAPASVPATLSCTRTGCSAPTSVEKQSRVARVARVAVLNRSFDGAAREASAEPALAKRLVQFSVA